MSDAAGRTGGDERPGLAIIGMGRMGRAVEALAAARGWRVQACITARQQVTATTLAGADVAIEFTTGAAAPGIIRACVAAGCAVVSGTTGWDSEMPAVWADVARANGTLLWAPNFAIGALLTSVAGVEVARALRHQEGYGAALVETHRAGKRDAPSGTARAIAGAVGAAWGRDLPVTSVRVGEVPGEHELIFDGPFEQIRIVHSVRDRRVFADGALTAAAWVVGRSGVFSMDDALRSPRVLPADPGARAESSHD